jgi:hypothetical protein
LLTVEEAYKSLDSIIEISKKSNPDQQVIFTISPVRYLKYGAHENQLSKSVLAIALQLIMKKYSGIHYFPAYEILLDELRDYRFYTEDMIHPSEIAVKYIWERFKESYFEDSAINLSLEIESINRAFEHRPHFQETEEHQAFLKLHFSKVCDLEKRYPYLNFSEEKKYFSDFH